MGQPAKRRLTRDVSWEPFCRFAREPERCKVGVDARVSVEGSLYEVEPDMAGEWVILLGACTTTKCTSNSTPNAMVRINPSPGLSRLATSANSSPERRRNVPTASAR